MNRRVANYQTVAEIAGDHKHPRRGEARKLMFDMSVASDLHHKHAAGARRARYLMDKACHDMAQFIMPTREEAPRGSH